MLTGGKIKEWRYNFGKFLCIETELKAVCFHRVVRIYSLIVNVICILIDKNIWVFFFIFVTKIHFKSIFGSTNSDVEYTEKSSKSRSLKRWSERLSQKYFRPEVFHKTSTVDKAKTYPTDSIFYTNEIKKKMNKFHFSIRYILLFITGACLEASIGGIRRYNCSRFMYGCPEVPFHRYDFHKCKDSLFLTQFFNFFLEADYLIFHFCASHLL